MRTGRPAARATPAPSLSWSTTDGRKWTILEVDGMLGAGGERFVAYRGDIKPPAWTSFDGVTRTPVAMTRLPMNEGTS